MQVKIFQLSRVNKSFAPSGSLESRTATTPGRFRATSTHWPPLLLLRVLCATWRGTGRHAYGSSRTSSAGWSRSFGCRLRDQRYRMAGAERLGAQMVKHHCIVPDLVFTLQEEAPGEVFEVNDGRIG